MTDRPLVVLRPLRRTPRPAPDAAETGAGSATAHPTAPPTTGSTADRAAVRREVTGLLAQVLYLDVEQIDPESPFQDLGVDSVLGVELVRGVRARFSVPVTSTALYEHSTVARFGDHVASLLEGSAEPDGATPTVEPPAAETVPARPAPSHTDVLHTLRERLAGVLYCEAASLDPGADFASLGLDSVLGVEFIRHVNDAFGLSARAGVLYEQTTLTDLAGWVVNQHGQDTGNPPPPTAAPSSGHTGTEVSELLAGVLNSELSVTEAAALLEARETAAAR